MNILGLSAFTDSSATIVRNGKIICAVEEERLNRVKHYEGMPWLAINECLKIASMPLREIDVIAIGWNPIIGWKTRILETIKSTLQMPQAFKGKVSRGNDYLSGCWEILKLRKSLRSRFSQADVNQKIVFVEHHLAHAASTFLVSPFEVADIIVADGIGESAAISFFTGKGSVLRRVGQIKFPHSLGHLYASVTGFLGFRMTHDEGKVMALASFGEDKYRELFARLVLIDKVGKTIKVDTKLLNYHAARNSYFSKEWLKLTRMTPRRKNEPLTQEHKNLACSLQKRVEETIFSLLDMHFSRGPERPLCAAGGLFLNSVMNGRIIRERNSRLFVQPAAGDNGVSLGAALNVSCNTSGNDERHILSNVYLGREFKDREIREALKRHSIKPHTTDNVFSETADLIAQGKVVGWLRGRMEFGPRALGNRSILACPTIARMKDIVNLQVKRREAFRPFAGSVILENAHEYFDDFQESCFMLKVFYFKNEYRSTFPAISHIDSSCRIQTVSEHQNPDLYRLLEAIKRRIGYGIVLNTSMNTPGEPIVNTPDEAIELIAKTQLDTLILKNYIVRKDQLRKVANLRRCLDCNQTLR